MTKSSMFFTEPEPCRAQAVEVAEGIQRIVADNPGKWLFHCHMLEHHMAGMGTWISVG